MLTVDGACRTQAVNHVLNDPVGFGQHGLTVGRLGRSCCRTRRPLEPEIFSLLPYSAEPTCCLGTNGLGCGRGCRKYDARCVLLMCSQCCQDAIRECPGGVHIVERRWACWIRGPGQLICDAGCVFCASQAGARPLTLVVFDAVEL